MQIESIFNTSIPYGTLAASKGGRAIGEFNVIFTPDGPWVFLDGGEKTLLHTLYLDSDRAVAIVVGSMMEVRLQRAMLSKLHRDEKIEKRLYHASGPLGSFSAKIDLAFQIGLLSKDAHDDLVILKNIRNDFAHDLSIVDFRSQTVSNKAIHFALIDSYVAETDLDPATGQPKILDLNPSARPALFIKNFAAAKKRAKDRYLLTARLFSVKFALSEIPDLLWPVI
jgi:hypothetical protein